MKHNNASIVAWCNRIFSPRGENLNPDVADFIQPTIEIKPTANIVRSNNSSGSGSLTAFTTPSDKDFFLTGLSFALIKDATCDNANALNGVSITQDGSSKSIVYCALLTLLAQTVNINVEFTQPIKIDRGTNISNTLSFTVGSCYRGLIIRGYTQETVSSGSN